MATKKDETVNVSKFEKTLVRDGKEIKSDRAANLALTVKMEVEDLVRKLTKEKLALVSKIDNLSDIGPDNSYSLRPTDKNFDAAKWVESLHETQLDLKLKQVELDAAQEILTEWFSNEG